MTAATAGRQRARSAPAWYRPRGPVHRHAPCATCLVRAPRDPLIILAALLAVLSVLASSERLSAWTAIFREDDPLAREPETQDASRAQAWEIDLFVDLSVNLFGQPGDRQTGVVAGNVNTIDEVPDSGWFTNRILARPVSIDEAVRAASTGDGPAPGSWQVIAAKEVGVAPGFTIVDTMGETWFLSFDARGHPQAATGAILVANKIFWTLGYWQVDNVLTSVRPERLLLGDTATVRPPSGKRRRMRPSDLDAVWERAHRDGDGSYRAVAARRLPGRPLGGFRFHGTQTRRSERCDSPRTSSRAARVEGLRRLDQSRRHESRQHPRHARDREWPRPGPTLFAGHRVDVWNRRDRPT